ncbi:Bug family tripartite tricarboxylate transporter substrate binding protein [Roseateles saccharophilus]|uniref:Tripartite-type tricarboxylate transporter receptor subunit TctC n=1 Tax=Roseateles saccharophilus TaxID=304 RepID=A0A4R3UIY8_ROSSA|nr:tripartite tricarboxylate transporter substrate binding protein [Roseateles saccharophilus]MDG0834359.1 tripartite tricarboxylate transporter substrate binding protein [Roseateles saccharophilus]TCU90722.1 tripartite-type tricarboxylate transporter receptor subunit TctC [Roseateles saccharophilus]
MGLSLVPDNRRRAILGAALAFTATGGWPQPTTAPLHLLIGAAPGSAMDISGRQIAEAFTAQTGQFVVVDNRPSAGGVLALDVVRRAPPDGQTLGFVYAMQMTAAPALFQSLPYDPMRDFTHVAILFVGVQVLVVPASLPIHTWAELISLAHERPQGLRYGTAGVGSPQHLSMELMRRSTGTKLLHIPYRGPAAVQATLVGEVDMTLEGLALLLPYIRAGRLRPIAVGGSRRLDVMPQVPTFNELGVPGVGEIWVGLVAPPGLPATKRASLQAAMARAVLALKADYVSIGRVVEPGTGDAMSETIRQETPVWRELIRSAGIKAE